MPLESARLIVLAKLCYQWAAAHTSFIANEIPSYPSRWTPSDTMTAQVRAIVAALSQLADAYLAVADEAAAEALAAFTAQQGSASNAASSQAGAQEKLTPKADAASQAPGSSSSQDLKQDPSGVKQDVAQRYPDHVHDPLKVQLELGKVKGAALQCVTELYRGLLYVVLFYCHRQRSSSIP